MSGITIVYNEHGGAVPEEGTCNYIAERKREKKRATTEEVIVDERVLRAAFSFARFLRLRAAKKLMKVARARGDGTTTLSGDKVIRAGNNERERKS